MTTAPPWKKPCPAKPARRLTAAQKAAARARAAAAGRRYPNLVDNILIAWILAIPLSAAFAFVMMLGLGAIFGAN